MDEHEMMAFELERILENTRSGYRHVPAYAKALRDSINNHRAQSRTYRELEKNVPASRLRNKS